MIDFAAARKESQPVEISDEGDDKEKNILRIEQTSEVIEFSQWPQWDHGKRHSTNRSGFAVSTGFGHVEFYAEEQNDPMKFWTEGKESEEINNDGDIELKAQPWHLLEYRDH